MQSRVFLSDHGIVLTNLSFRWIQEQLLNLQTAKVAVLYASAYGNTASLAQAISRGITKAGVGVEMINLEQVSTSEAEEILLSSQGFCIGKSSVPSFAVLSCLWSVHAVPACGPCTGKLQQSVFCAALAAWQHSERASCCDARCVWSRASRAAFVHHVGMSRRAVAGRAGSPTLGGHMPTQVSAMLGNILRLEAAKALPCGAYGSFGWSGEAVDILHGRLKDSGFPIAFDPIKIQFRPDAKAIQVCEESGTDLAQGILKARKKQQVQTERRATNTGAANTSGTIAIGLGLGFSGRFKVKRTVCTSST